MAIGINLGDDDNEDVGPFSHWNEDFEDGELEEDLQTWPGNQETDEDDLEKEDQDEMETNFPEYSKDSKNAGRFIGLDHPYVPGDPGL